MGIIISKISLLYKLNSYSEVMQVISPNIFGKLTGIITTLYFISSASIILAGSGALIHQFFGIPKIIGTLIMLCISLFFLLRGTEGLIEVNSFIVRGLILFMLQQKKVVFLYLHYYIQAITYYVVQVFLFLLVQK